MQVKIIVKFKFDSYTTWKYEEASRNVINKHNKRGGSGGEPHKLEGS